MRISDWSSDVCSSDLGRPDPADGVDRRGEEREIEERPEPADEEHDFGGDEQDHAVAEMELHHRRVIAVMRFLDDVAPPQAHRQQYAGQAEKENPAAAIGLVRAQMPAVHPRSEEHTSEL